MNTFMSLRGGRRGNLVFLLVAILVIAVSLFLGRAFVAFGQTAADTATFDLNFTSGQLDHMVGALTDEGVCSSPESCAAAFEKNPRAVIDVCEKDIKAHPEVFTKEQVETYEQAADAVKDVPNEVLNGTADSQTIIAAAEDVVAKIEKLDSKFADEVDLTLKDVQTAATVADTFNDIGAIQQRADAMKSSGAIDTFTKYQDVFGGSGGNIVPTPGGVDGGSVWHGGTDNTGFGASKYDAGTHSYGGYQMNPDEFAQFQSWSDSGGSSHWTNTGGTSGGNVSPGGQTWTPSPDGSWSGSGGGYAPPPSGGYTMPTDYHPASLLYTLYHLLYED